MNERTRKKILVEDYSKDFVLDLPIGYFCHDSAKNKFLDLFSALAAPKIRAVGDPQLNPPQKQRTVAHFQLGFLLKILFSSILNDILFLAIGHIFIKDFLQDFLRSNSQNQTALLSFSGHRPFFNKDFLQDLPVVCFVVTQHSESALSLCLRYSKTSSAATKKSV